MCIGLLSEITPKQVKQAPFLLTDISELLKHAETIIYLLTSFQLPLSNSLNLCRFH